jgi:hypothetical protein
MILLLPLWGACPDLSGKVGMGVEMNTKEAHNIYMKSVTRIVKKYIAVGTVLAMRHIEIVSCI